MLGLNEIVSTKKKSDLNENGRKGEEIGKSIQQKLNEQCNNDGIGISENLSPI